MADGGRKSGDEVMTEEDSIYEEMLKAILDEVREDAGEVAKQTREKVQESYEKVAAKLMKNGMAVPDKKSFRRIWLERIAEMEIARSPKDEKVFGQLTTDLRDIRKELENTKVELEKSRDETNKVREQLTLWKTMVSEEEAKREKYGGRPLERGDGKEKMASRRDLHGVSEIRASTPRLDEEHPEDDEPRSRHTTAERRKEIRKCDDDGKDDFHKLKKWGLSRFDGSYAFLDWAKRYEYLTEEIGWNDKKRAVALPRYIEKQAFEQWATLETDVKKDWKEIMETMDQKFPKEEKTVVTARAEWSNIVQKKGESVPELAARIDKMAPKAFPFTGKEGLDMEKMTRLTKAVFLSEVRNGLRIVRFKSFREMVQEATRIDCEFREERREKEYSRSGRTYGMAEEDNESSENDERERKRSKPAKRRTDAQKDGERVNAMTESSRGAGAHGPWPVYPSGFGPTVMAMQGGPDMNAQKELMSELQKRMEKFAEMEKRLAELNVDHLMVEKRARAAENQNGAGMQGYGNGYYGNRGRGNFSRGRGMYYNNNGNRPRGCYECGEVGHFRNECPRLTGSARVATGGNAEPLTRDSGASASSPPQAAATTGGAAARNDTVRLGEAGLQRTSHGQKNVGQLSAMATALLTSSDEEESTGVEAMLFGGNSVSMMSSARTVSLCSSDDEEDEIDLKIRLLQKEKHRKQKKLSYLSSGHGGNAASHMPKKLRAQMDQFKKDQKVDDPDHEVCGVIVPVLCGPVSTAAMLDSGSTLRIISEKLARSIELMGRGRRHQSNTIAALFGSGKDKIEFEHAMNVEVSLCRVHASIEVQIYEKMHIDMLIGHASLRGARAVIDYGEATVGSEGTTVRFL